MPRLLDLFCGAGGCAVGYHRAGFEVVGVDIKPQPRYPFPWFQQDALEALRNIGQDFDVIHASPPCEGYSRMRHLPWLKGREYPLLLEPVRKALIAAGRPYVIENVADSPVRGITLCGSMFGLKVYRHRRFESDVYLWQPEHKPHRRIIGAGALLESRRAVGEDGWVSVIGKAKRSVIEAAKSAMGIEWMHDPEEVSKAIPPAYTEYIGKQLLAILEPSVLATPLQSP